MPKAHGLWGNIRHRYLFPVKKNSDTIKFGITRMNKKRQYGVSDALIPAGQWSTSIRWIFSNEGLPGSGRSVGTGGHWVGGPQVAGTDKTVKSRVLQAEDGYGTLEQQTYCTAYCRMGKGKNQCTHTNTVLRILIQG